jgi:hypothetical protein
MDLLTRLTRYQDYISGQLAEAEINEGSASTLLEVAKARHITSGWTGASDDRVAIVKAEALLDGEVRQADDALTQLKAKRKLYNVMVEALARDAAVVSREISRRIGRAPHEARSDRYS